MNKAIIFAGIDGMDEHYQILIDNRYDSIHGERDTTKTLEDTIERFANLIVERYSITREPYTFVVGNGKRLTLPGGKIKVEEIIKIDENRINVFGRKISERLNRLFNHHAFTTVVEEVRN